jgi:hypothetical protein
MSAMAHGSPRRPSRPEAEAKLLKESISLLRGEAAPGRKTVRLATFEHYKED